MTHPATVRPRGEALMASRLFGLLAVIGLVLLAATAIGIAVYQLAPGDTPTQATRESAATFAIRVAAPGETPSASDTSTLAEGGLLHFGGELEFPSRLSSHNSGAISLALGAADAASSSPADLGNRTARSAPILLTLPPGLDPSDVLLTAELYAAGFEVQPEAQQRQSLDRQPVTWDWVLRPRGAGEQAFVVQIVATWLEDGAPRTQILWRTRDGHTIDVPADDRSPITPAALSVTGVLGAALTLCVIPWLLTRPRTPARAGRRGTFGSEGEGSDRYA